MPIKMHWKFYHQKKKKKKKKKMKKKIENFQMKNSNIFLCLLKS